MAEFVIGIDIGGTNTVLGAVDAHGNILGERSFPTANYASFELYFQALTREIEQLSASGTLLGVGLGAPAGNRFQSTIVAPANVPWQGSLAVGQLLTKAFGVRAVIDNDANAAAIGEMVYGAARGLNDFILITLGTGLGSGIVIDGRLVYGAHGFAGELGHIAAIAHGRRCGCGKRGCLETYASAPGLRRTAYELMANTLIYSVLRKMTWDEMSAYAIAQAAEMGDALALEAFAYTGEVLGRTLADYVAFSEPEAFVLFGGLAKSGGLILEPARKAFAENLLFLYRDKVDIRLSELMDKNAAVLGSAALVWDEILRERI